MKILIFGCNAIILHVLWKKGNEYAKTLFVLRHIFKTNFNFLNKKEKPRNGSDSENTQQIGVGVDFNGVGDYFIYRYVDYER